MKSLFLCALLLLSFKGWCQNPTPSNIFYEKHPDGLYSFYFDSQYFLVDKNCEFASIERVSGYNPTLKTFEGTFTDYDTNGTIVLSGTYRNGKKEGAFKSFFPNGFLKWQIEFANGIPKGDWYYYYPDGKPRSIIKITPEKIFVTNAWNAKGKAVIRNGTGKFELEDPAFGFNELGYETIVYQGTMKEGLPNGTWRIFYQYPGGQREVAAIETFDKGSFTMGILSEDNSSYPSSRLRFIPTEPYLNAEAFTSKNCNVDDYYNYTLYLSQYLSNNFTGIIHPTVRDENIEFVVEVDKKGIPHNIELTKPFIDEVANKALLYILHSITYWIPSQKNGQTIADRLLVKATAFTDPKGKISFSNIKITRSAGT